MVNIENILRRLALHERRALEGKQQLSIGLLSGDMASVMFLYEYSKIDPSYQNVADIALDRVLEQLRTGNVISTYCSGVAGFVIGLDTLCELGFVEDFSSLLLHVDRYIASSQSAMLRHNRHDFLHGFIGLGFYWLMRYASNPGMAVARLSDILCHLLSNCERDHGRIKWPLPETKWVKRYNISLSHGCSSTLVLLCRMLQMPELKQSMGDSILELIHGVVDYIMFNRVDHQKCGCWFASSSLECEQPYRSRLAWCYGDLGIAVALYHAAHVIGDSELHDLSLRVLEYAAVYRRDLRQNYVQDACVCHGAAGIGLVFREMARATGSVLLADAADFWREVVLRWAIADGDNCYFKYYNVSQTDFCEGTGILEGNAGVASFLLNERYHSSLGRFLLIN